jgi:acetyl esterase/lipase
MLEAIMLPERIAYGSAPSQFGELRRPPGGPRPVVALLHGGFWRAPYGLDGMDDVAEALTRHGLATWNLEYRRVGEPGGGWPGTFDDVARGLEAARALDGVDARALTAIGFSAGGHLALWATSRGAVDGAVALAAVSDLALAARVAMNRGIVGELLGGGPDDVPERYAAASPMQLLPARVPVRLVHGTDDDLVPIDLSRAYVARARAAGDDAALIAVDGAGHFDLVDPRAPAWASVQGAIDALLAG